MNTGLIGSQITASGSNNCFCLFNIPLPFPPSLISSSLPISNFLPHFWTCRSYVRRLTVASSSTHSNRLVQSISQNFNSHYTTHTGIIFFFCISYQSTTKPFYFGDLISSWLKDQAQPDLPNLPGVVCRQIRYVERERDLCGQKAGRTYGKSHLSIYDDQTLSIFQTDLYIWESSDLTLIISCSFWRSHAHSIVLTTAKLSRSSRTTTTRWTRSTPTARWTLTTSRRSSASPSPRDPRRSSTSWLSSLRIPRGKYVSVKRQRLYHIEPARDLIG